MKASEYRAFKGLRKESLRDNMTDIEVALTDLGEIATRELAKEHKPYGLEQNKNIARRGGNIAKITRDNLEKELELCDGIIIPGGTEIEDYHFRIVDYLRERIFQY